MHIGSSVQIDTLRKFDKIKCYKQHEARIKDKNKS